MSSLTGQKIKDTYQSLLKTDDNGLVTNVFKNITDGSGSASGLYLKNDGVYISGSLVLSGSLLYSGSTINITVTSASHALTASYALNANTPTLQQVTNQGNETTGQIKTTNGLFVYQSFAGNTVGGITNGGDVFGTTLRAIPNPLSAPHIAGIINGSLITVNRTFNLPDLSGIFVLSVNGYTASSAGDVNIPTGSSFMIDTGSFATTGSNVFRGQQVISSSLIVVSQSLVDPIVDFIGTSGSLMRVYDSNSGSIFSVNNDLGLPILNVKSDQTVFIGEYQSPALYTSTRKSVNSGSNTNVYSFSTSSYDSFFIDYSAKSGSLAQVGKMMAIWNGTSISYSEFATHSIGLVSDFYIGLELSGSNIALLSSASSDNWTLNTIIKAI